MRLIFSLRLQKASRQMSAPNVIAKRKKTRHVVTIFSLVVAVAFALLLGGCADAYYANNGIHSPRRAIILTTGRIIIRTIHGTVTTAARITTASKPR